MKPTTIMLGGCLAAASQLPLLAAQQVPESPQPGGLGQSAVSDYLLPIHTQSPRLGVGGGDYGLWASGARYKASFDDGFTFYPVLGEAYPHNLPLRWRTEEISVGGQILVQPQSDAISSHTDWRYELRYGPVTEAYDVRDDGVEQTFVFNRRVGPVGDIVVTGRMDSRLDATKVLVAEHQNLRFRGPDGEDIVDYGAAFAIDARGRRLPISTSFDGELVRLTVPGAWLETASWPVTIDPLTSTVSLGSSSVRADQPSIGRDDAHNEVLIAYSRRNSNSDHDLFVKLRDDDLSSRSTVFSDITATRSTRDASVDFSRGANRWVVAYRHTFQAVSSIRVYFHDGANTAFNSGTSIAIPRAANSHHSAPSIGASTRTNNDMAYLVFQVDPGATPQNSESSRVLGIRINAQNRATQGGFRNLHTSGISNYDAELPSVTAQNRNDGWMVVWQEYNFANSGDDWDAIGQRIMQDGTLVGHATLGSGGQSVHSLNPQVAGTEGRYLISYARRDNTGKTGARSGNLLRTQRFDWLDSSSAPTSIGYNALDDSTSNYLSLGNRSISYDYNTDSHWSVAWRKFLTGVRIARCGFGGGAVETQLIDAGASTIHPTVCYDDDAYAFVFAYVGGGTNFQVPAGRLEYFATATSQSYGTSCSGTIVPDNQGARNLPFAGSEFYSLRLVNGAPNVPTWLFAGFAPANIPLPSSPGCSLLMDLAVSPVLIAQDFSNGMGTLDVDILLPDSVSSATLYWQFLQLDGGVLRSSTGLRTDIR